ncbi:hypothetical protein [Gordonia sp. NPDC003585]|uniref:hypothetical protein n=1 Tax=Gordonia sp. NPDC003585 TaxID=3154275 RepID=UPI0033A4ABF7
MSEPQSWTTPGGRNCYTLAFKVQFLQDWDRCVEYGSKARMLRERGVSDRTVRDWLGARARGNFEAAMVAEATKKGKAKRVDSRDRAELARLRTENERLKTKVAQAEAAQEVLGKAFELLEGITKSSTDPQTEIPAALMSAEQYRQWLQRQGLS